MTEQTGCETEKLSTRFWTTVFIGLLGLWGALAIFNSMAAGGGEASFLTRQLIWLGIGMLVFWLAAGRRSSFYSRWRWIFNICFYIPLWVVLIPAIGHEANGMRGWFSFGWFYAQPAELAKGPYMLSLYLTATGKRPRRWAWLTALWLAWLIPILLEPDFGTALVYSCGFIIVYWCAGLPCKPLLATGALLTIPIYAMCSVDYVSRRFVGFLWPDSDPGGAGWHVIQFRHTLARGGAWGAGLGESYWSSAYLPLPHSDSVFASLTECFGAVGVLPIIALFALLPLAVWRLSENRPPRQRTWIMAACSLVTVQALVHMSVNVTLLPPTGITLPFFSYGGSSLVGTCLLFGMAFAGCGRHGGTVSPNRSEQVQIIEGQTA